MARTPPTRSRSPGKRNRIRERWAQRGFSPADLLNLWKPNGAWEKYDGLAYGGKPRQKLDVFKPRHAAKAPDLLRHRYLAVDHGAARPPSQSRQQPQNGGKYPRPWRRCRGTDLWRGRSSHLDRRLCAWPASSGAGAARRHSIRLEADFITTTSGRAQDLFACFSQH